VGEHEATLEALDRAGDLEAFPTKAALAATIRTRALLDLGRTDEARESAALASTRATEARLEGPAVAAVHLARASALAESDPGESAKARRAAARAFEAAGTETSVIERIQAAS
jgi:hypothetical protein